MLPAASVRASYVLWRHLDQTSHQTLMAAGALKAAVFKVVGGMGFSFRDVIKFSEV